MRVENGAFLFKGGIYMQLIVKSTQELSNFELTKIFEERTRVFVVEQECPYQEIDEHDTDAKHVILKNEHNIVAYTRIIEEQNTISFGRVLVSKNYRGNNYGRQILEETIKYIKEHSNKEKINISAQTYLQSFYESFGFIKMSEMYLEDGIPYIDMILNIER